MVYKTKYESKIYILGPLGEKSGSRKSSCVFQFLPPDGVNQKGQIHFISYNKSLLYISTTGYLLYILWFLKGCAAEV